MRKWLNYTLLNAEVPSIISEPSMLSTGKGNIINCGVIIPFIPFPKMIRDIKPDNILLDADGHVSFFSIGLFMFLPNRTFFRPTSLILMSHYC